MKKIGLTRFLPPSPLWHQTPAQWPELLQVTFAKSPWLAQTLCRRKSYKSDGKKPYLDLSSTILLRRGADAAPRRAGEQGSAKKTVMGKGIVSHDVVPIFEHKMENMPIVRRWRIRIWELLVRFFFPFSKKQV